MCILRDTVTRYSEYTFVEAYIKGLAFASHVEDWVEAWHAGITPYKELYEALGFTPDEYSEWVKTPSYIHKILKDRRKKAGM